MKILFLTLNTFDKHGGIQTFNKYFMKALDENKYSWKMISFHDASAHEDDRIYCCNSNLIRFVFRLLRLADKETVVVWGHISLGVVLQYLKIVLRNKINILLTHGTEVWLEDLTPRKKKVFPFMEQIWSVSKFTREKIIQNHGVEETKLRYFPNCIYRLGKSGFDNPFLPGKFNIISLLRLDLEPKLSAVYNVLDALPSVLNRGVPIHFTIIGSGNAEDVLTQYVRENGLGDHVTFTGFVDDPNPYLEHCDLFSLISDVEGFGIVFLEAMQFSKCCIAGKNCGSSDVVIDGETGICVEVNDIQTLEEEIVKVASNVSYRKTLGDRGQKHMIKNFTFESFKKNQLRLLENIFERG